MHAQSRTLSTVARNARRWGSAAPSVLCLVQQRTSVAARRCNSNTPRPDASSNPGPSSQGQKTEPITGGSISRDKAAVGVFTPKAAAVFVLTGIGLYFYFDYEKKKLQEEKKKELETRRWGKAAVGGPFQLSTHTEQPFTEKDLLGKWSLVYFGFTNCPDICPDELDKMTEVVNQLDKDYGSITQPIFVSVDPARDPPKQVAHYVQDFHPRLIGLSGTYEQTKAMCKAYRVYFSTPKDAKADGDYLVDHSIYFYLMDPEGEFVEAFGKVNTAEDVVKKAREEIERWKEAHGRTA